MGREDGKGGGWGGGVCEGGRRPPQVVRRTLHGDRPGGRGSLRPCVCLCVWGAVGGGGWGVVSVCVWRGGESLCMCVRMGGGESVCRLSLIGR